jgi:hypothetical protein
VNEVLRAALDVQTFCERKEWKFCIIGGLALIRWGEPRETVDVDLTLLTGFGGEEPFVQGILSHYKSRISDAARFALQNRVVLVQAPSGVGIDVALAGLPFEEKCDRPLFKVSLFPLSSGRISELSFNSTRGQRH